jgi:hypothetical protein
MFKDREAAGRQPQKVSYPLSPRAHALVAELSGSIKLRALPGEHPEVLDLLARHWNDPRDLARAFDQIVFGTAGVPKLSMLALLEVTALKRHARSRLPQRKPSVWDLAFDAVR